MPAVSLPFSPLVPGVSPVEIYYREEGHGEPLVLLHGGWGYGLNPFNRQLEKLRDEFRVIAPDRSGYGGSTRLNNGFSIDFHYRAAAETLSFLDALGIEQAFFGDIVMAQSLRQSSVSLRRSESAGLFLKRFTITE